MELCTYVWGTGARCVRKKKQKKLYNTTVPSLCGMGVILTDVATCSVLLYHPVIGFRAIIDFPI